MSARTTTAATLTLAALLLAGCGEANEPSVLGTASPAAAAVSASPGESATIAPSTSVTGSVAPTAAPAVSTPSAPVEGADGGTLSAVDYAAAETAIRSWLDAVNTAEATDDPSGLASHFTVRCEVCLTTATQIADDIGKGNLQGGELGLLGLRLTSVSADYATFEAGVSLSPATWTPADGGEPTEYGGDENIKYVIVLDLAEADRWKISTFDAVS